MPFARVLVFVLALTHAVGLADLVFDDACAEACDDDGCADSCVPDATCRCHCPSTMPLVGVHVPVIAKLDLPPAMTTCAFEARAHANPDPREILHVPRVVA